MKKLKKDFNKDRTSLIIPLYNEENRLDHCFKIIEKIPFGHNQPFHSPMMPFYLRLYPVSKFMVQR